MDYRRTSEHPEDPNDHWDFIPDPHADPCRFCSGTGAIYQDIGRGTRPRWNSAFCQFCEGTGYPT